MNKLQDYDLDLI